MLQTAAHINTRRTVGTNSLSKLNKIHVSHYLHVDRHEGTEASSLLKGRRSPNDGDDEVYRVTFKQLTAAVARSFKFGFFPVCGGETTSDSRRGEPRRNRPACTKIKAQIDLFAPFCGQG